MNRKIDFKTIEYLKEGNDIQRKTHRILIQFKILQILKSYNPIVVGTIPINININDSDVDIILETKKFHELEVLLIDQFKKFDHFHCSISDKNEGKTLVCNFTIEKLPFELFASSITTSMQYGYLHMIKEYEILNHYGQDFAEKIKNLKRVGYKTEPAFCKVLNIEGDPYEELLNYTIKN